MSENVNFLEIPTRALTFEERLRASWRSTAAFMQDQKWVSLFCLLAYVGLMYWDFHYAVPGVVASDENRWLHKLPDFLQDFINGLTPRPSATGTWRGSIAALVFWVYWVNALLYIANRSEAFRAMEVVGLVRLVLRGAGVVLLMFVPVVFGLALLIVPGLVLMATTLVATNLVVFKEQSIFRAIESGFRLTTQSLSHQKRVLGFSPNFFALIGAYFLAAMLPLIFSWAFNAIGPHFWPEQPVALQYIHSGLTSLCSSYLELVFSVFALRLYAERIYVLPTDEKEFA